MMYESVTRAAQIEREPYKAPDTPQFQRVCTAELRGLLALRGILALGRVGGWVGGSEPSRQRTPLGTFSAAVAFDSPTAAARAQLRSNSLATCQCHRGRKPDTRNCGSGQSPRPSAAIPDPPSQWSRPRDASSYHQAGSREGAQGRSRAGCHKLTISKRRDHENSERKSQQGRNASKRLSDPSGTT